jgi:hypothetical protein
MFLSGITFHNIIISPCRATTNWHPVTTNLGTRLPTRTAASGAYG